MTPFNTKILIIFIDGLKCKVFGLHQLMSSTKLGLNHVKS